MAMVSVSENDEHDAHEYLQNLYGNLAWGAAHLQNLLEWAEDQGANPWGETPTKKPRNQAPPVAAASTAATGGYAGPTPPASLGNKLSAPPAKNAGAASAAAASYTGGGHPVPNSESTGTAASSNAVYDSRCIPAGCRGPRVAPNLD